jgi:hypothetical protein
VAIYVLFFGWSIIWNSVLDHRLLGRFEEAVSDTTNEPNQQLSEAEMGALGLTCALSYFDGCGAGKWLDFRGPDRMCKFAHALNLPAGTATDGDGAFAVERATAWYLDGSGDSGGGGGDSPGASSNEGRSLAVAVLVRRKDFFTTSARRAVVKGVILSADDDRLSAKPMATPPRGDGHASSSSKATTTRHRFEGTFRSAVGKRGYMRGYCETKNIIIHIDAKHHHHEAQLASTSNHKRPS